MTETFKRPRRLPKRLSGTLRTTTPEHKLRKHIISIRLDDGDYEKVKSLAKQQCASISTYCRDAAVRRRLRELPTSHEHELWLRLGSLGSRLSRLKDQASADWMVPPALVEALAQTVAEIQFLREKLTCPSTNI